MVKYLSFHNLRRFRAKGLKITHQHETYVYMTRYRWGIKKFQGETRPNSSLIGMHNVNIGYVDFQ
jgi:hypothetical protein